MPFQRRGQIINEHCGKIGLVQQYHLHRRSIERPPRQIIGEFSRLDIGFNKQVAQRVPVHELSRLGRRDRHILQIPVGCVNRHIAVHQSALLETRTHCIALGPVCPALIEKRKAEPGTVIGLVLQPDLCRVDIREKCRDRYGRKFAVFGRMVGQHMSGLGIGRDIGGVMVISGNPSRIDEENRLFNACGLQCLDQQFWPFIRLQKSAGAARGVVKAEGDAFVGHRNGWRQRHRLACCIFRRPESEQNDCQQQ